MDVGVITQLIGSLGFPIVCCGYMMLKMNKTIEKNTEVTEATYDLIKALLATGDTGTPNIKEVADNE